MSSQLFQVELVGGPKDGYSTSVDFLPGVTVVMPASCASAGDGWRPDDVEAGHAAQYLLARAGYGRDANNLPVVTMQYKFVGVAPVGGAWRRNVVLIPRARAFRGAKRAISLRERFVAWLLKPIAFPMQTPPLILPFESRLVRKSSAAEELNGS